MYDTTKLMFLYACSPVHMGAGVSLGPIDLPIQRERSSDYPMMQGSGIKGALRHAFDPRSGGTQAATHPEISVLFGPSSGKGEERPSDHAGALAFGDGKLVLFPVRSLLGSFAYCTSRLALARLKRDLEWSGHHADWQVPSVIVDGKALHAAGSGVVGSGGPESAKAIVLEDFSYESSESADLTKAARDLAAMVTGGAEALRFFAEKMEKDLVLLSDEDFVHFVKFATEVEPHVAIDEKTGTAKEGAFFYEEHLPADAVLYCVVGCSGGRSEKSGEISLGTPDAVAGKFQGLLGGTGRRVQFGGDGTTGRGVFYARLAENGGAR